MCAAIKKRPLIPLLLSVVGRLATDFVPLTTTGQRGALVNLPNHTFTHHQATPRQQPRQTIAVRVCRRRRSSSSRGLSAPVDVSSVCLVSSICLSVCLLSLLLSGCCVCNRYTERLSGVVGLLLFHTFLVATIAQLETNRPSGNTTTCK